MMAQGLLWEFVVIRDTHDSLFISELLSLQGIMYLVSAPTFMAFGCSASKLYFPYSSVRTQVRRHEE